MRTKQCFSASNKNGVPDQIAILFARFKPNHRLPKPLAQNAKKSSVQNATKSGLTILWNVMSILSKVLIKMCLFNHAPNAKYQSKSRKDVFT